MQQGLDLAAPDAPQPAARLGSHDAPLGGPHFADRAPRFLLGIQCDCGQTLLVYAAAYESTEALHCPACQASLR